MDIMWLSANDSKLLAWTKAYGSEVGGIWYSGDGAVTWVERTAALSICPPEYPFLCARLQVCYKDAASAQRCVGDPGTWCGLPGLAVPDHITTQGWGTWCSNGCPATHPYYCESLGVCYKSQADASPGPGQSCSGPPGTWCALPGTQVTDQIPLYGSYCGNNATKGDRETVEVWAVFADKENPQNVVALGTGAYIWTSTDYGQTFNASQTSIQTPRWRLLGADYKVHPWHSNWLLLKVKRPDCRIQDHAATFCPYDLMLTKNLFDKERTWTNLTANAGGQVAGFVDFDWGAALCPGGPDECPQEWNGKITDTTIMATLYRKAGDYDQAWDKDVHYAISYNEFTTIHVQMYCGNMFEIIGKTIYLAYANTCPVDINGNQRPVSDRLFTGVDLFTSLDGGSTWTQACLPVALMQKGYELMSTHDGTGAIVIAEFDINNGYMDVPASSIYTAGPHHALFSLSMTDAYRADYGFQTDFARVEGLPGVYIANQMVSRMDGSDYSYGSMDDAATLVQTRITFNGGGKWSAIPAPSSFSHSRCNRCLDGIDQCYLHLRGMSTYESMAYPAVYSNPSAPGLVMATGITATTGMGLLDDEEHICTWLSTDGGVSWKDVAEGSYIYEYADWGGVIIMAASGGSTPADEVRYSIDYGSSWVSVPLAAALWVDNIRIEPDGQRTWVVIHGRACEVGRDASRAKCTVNSTDSMVGTPGLMYTLDVAARESALRRFCVYPGDYEMFSLPTSRDNPAPACTLGKVMRVMRRSPSKPPCLLGPDWGQQRGLPQNVTCDCTANDVECDYGYIWYGGKCTPIVRDRMPACPVIDQGKYTVSASGKRLVHADVCTGIEAIIADTDGKGGRTGPGWEPGPGGHGGHGGRRGLSGVAKFFISMAVIIVVTGAFVAWWVFAATERQRDAVRDVVSRVVATVSGLAQSAYGAVMERVRGRRADLHEQDLGYFQPLNEMESQHQPAGIFTLK